MIFSKIEIFKKKKHLQKRKGRRGGLRAKPVAGSDGSLDSHAPHLSYKFQQPNIGGEII
jgi:hypothetical protein